MDTTTVSGNPTLDWLTLLAASVAAVGAILGPIITYRSVKKTIQRDKDEFVESQRQKDIDLYVTVMPADIERARLVVSLNNSLNKKTPASIRKITAARPR